MRSLRNVPIQRKLTILTMLTSCVALLIACLAFVAYELVVFRTGMVADLSSTAEMLGDNSSAALSFNDPASAAETLKSLHLDPDVVGAALYDKNGRLFATYRRAVPRTVFATYRRAVPQTVFTPPAVEPTGSRFADDRLRLFRSIDLAGESIGTIYVESDLEAMRSRLWRYAAIVVLVLLVSSAVALLLSNKLQTSISEPISRLAEVVDYVATEKDYSVRVAKDGDDELGRLIDGFNHMLAQTQKHDAELHGAQNELERRVEERTRELKLEVAEHQRSEAALLESNQRFEIVIRATTNVIWDWDLHANTVTWNDNFQTVFGYSGDEIGNTLESWSARVHPEDTPVLLASVHAFLEGCGSLWSGEYRFRRHDGSFAFILDRGCVLRDERGQPVRMLGAMQDFTDRKRAEEELRSTHQQLLDASRHAGMAEIATNVLHNVGNVLNSLNVSASLLADGAKRSKAGSLARVGELLAAHQGDLASYLRDDVRGRQLPAYLAQLAENLSADQEATAGEIASLRANVDHIKEIVAMQQSYAKVSGVLEVVDVVALVEDSLRINGAALDRHGVEVVREFAPVPRVNVDKHKIVQILVNLLRNAKYACDESGRGDKRMTLRVENGDGRIRISVCDNGIGIAPENLARIFSHGFTTRASGHGFGLHSGALAARELGGSLQAFSDGPGRGATFILELPVQPVETPR
jgi:PAS domain S-box-containing protein